MNKLFVILFFSIASISNLLAGNQKVVDRSSKKAPSWLTEQVEDYLVINVEAPTLKEAQDLAMNVLSERIANSVASNISSSQTYSIDHNLQNGQLDERESFTMATHIRAANLPFIKGISMNKITDFYWEKLEDKTTRRKSYMYSMLYPFSKKEQTELSAQFEKLDNEKTKKYEELSQNFNNITDALQIKNAIIDLETLESYFFDSSRLKATQGLKKKYKTLYSQITLNVEQKGENKFLLQAYLGDQPLSFASVPTIEANCAGAIETTPMSGGFLISCSTEDCLEEEENYLDVTVRLDGNKYKKRIFLN